MAWARHGHGIATVNQTRPHWVNQMEKTHSKPLAAWYGRGTAWARHAMCESAFTATHSWHAQALHIILCEIPKVKAWRMFYQQLCCWMHSTNSAVCQQMCPRLRSYLKAHIFRLFTDPRNKHQFCAENQWNPIHIAHILQTTAQVLNLLLLHFIYQPQVCFGAKHNTLMKENKKPQNLFIACNSVNSVTVKCYAMWGRISLPTFRGNLSIPSAIAKKSEQSLEDGIDGLNRNVVIHYRLFGTTYRSHLQ
jgi:hypothetical protein